MWITSKSYRASAVPFLSLIFQFCEASQFVLDDGSDDTRFYPFVAFFCLLLSYIQAN